MLNSRLEDLLLRSASDGLVVTHEKVDAKATVRRGVSVESLRNVFSPVETEVNDDAELAEQMYACLGAPNYFDEAGKRVPSGEEDVGDIPLEHIVRRIVKNVDHTALEEQGKARAADFT